MGLGREIFVSYSRNDKSIVLPYVKLISEAVGRNCWIDLKGIESGIEFEEVIIKAIDECQVVLFMLSDSSLRSKWTKREVIYAEDEGKRIVPVLVDGEKLRGWFKFHFGNVDFIDIRSEEQKEKLVANLRTWLGVEKEGTKRKADEETKLKTEKINRADKEESIRITTFDSLSSNQKTLSKNTSSNIFSNNEKTGMRPLMAGSVIPQKWRWYYWLFFPVLLYCDTPKDKQGKLLKTLLKHPFIWMMLLQYFTYTKSIFVFVRLAFEPFPFSSLLQDFLESPKRYFTFCFMCFVNLIGGVFLIYPAGKMVFSRLEIPVKKLFYFAVCHLIFPVGGFLCTAAYLLLVPLFYMFYMYIVKKCRWDLETLIKVCKKQVIILLFLFPLFFYIHHCLQRG